MIAHRYLELNPIRAKMVAHPRDFPWSSYRCNAEGAPSTFLKPHPLYEALGESAAVRQAAYRTAFANALTDSELERIRDAINSGFALGSEEFLQRLKKQLRRKVQRGTNGRPRQPDDEFRGSVAL
jgi:putative transposase